MEKKPKNQHKAKQQQQKNPNAKTATYFKKEIGK